MSYQVTANRKPAIICFFILFCVGFALISAPVFGLKNYVGIVQFLGFFVVILSLLLFNRYLLTNYLYEIESEPNALSALPKLNIYASRGHNFGHQFFCVPLEDCYGIEKWESQKKPDFPCYNSCGSIKPKERYLVSYDCEDKKNGVLIECDAAFADEIKNMIDRYSKYRPEESQ